MVVVPDPSPATTKYPLDHVEKIASNGRRAVAGLKILRNTVQGVETKVIRRAVHACILPILRYAAPAWWPGRTRLDKHGKTIRNGVEGQLTRLDKVQNIALRYAQYSQYGGPLLYKLCNAKQPHSSNRAYPRLFMRTCVAPLA